MSRGVTIARRIPGPKAALIVWVFKSSQARRCFPLDNSIFSVSHSASPGPLDFEPVLIGLNNPASEAAAEPVAQLETTEREGGFGRRE